MYRPAYTNEHTKISNMQRQTNGFGDKERKPTTRREKDLFILLLI